MTKKPTTKQPAPQAEPAKRAAEIKAKNAAKRAQPYWLQRPQRPMPALESDPAPASPERLNAAHLSQGPPGPPRLLDKKEILAITGVSFVTIWTWMRANEFPRSRMAGGKSVWVSSEVERWVSELPRTRLKGDEAAA